MPVSQTESLIFYTDHIRSGVRVVPNPQFVEKQPPKLQDIVLNSILCLSGRLLNELYTCKKDRNLICRLAKAKAIRLVATKWSHIKVEDFHKLRVTVGEFKGQIPSSYYDASDTVSLYVRLSQRIPAPYLVGGYGFTRNIRSVHYVNNLRTVALPQSKKETTV